MLVVLTLWSQPSSSFHPAIMSDSLSALLLSFFLPDTIIAPALAPGGQIKQFNLHLVGPFTDLLEDSCLALSSHKRYFINEQEHTAVHWRFLTVLRVCCRRRPVSRIRTT